MIFNFSETKYSTNPFTSVHLFPRKKRQIILEELMNVLKKKIKQAMFESFVSKDNLSDIFITINNVKKLNK